MVGVSASVFFPCTIKVQKKFLLLAPGHPGSPGKRAIKWLGCIYSYNTSELTAILQVKLGLPVAC